MAQLRATLGAFLGYADQARLDDELAFTHQLPVVIVGDRGSERRHLAAALHFFSRRRRRRFVDVPDPRQRRAALLPVVEEARGGSVFVTLDRLGHRASLSHFVALAFDRARDIWPIFAARSIQEARGVLDSAAHQLRPLVIPAIASRRAEVPLLLDRLLQEDGSPHRVRELGPERIEAMSVYKWPRNHEELRETATRLAALLESDGNLSVAAASIHQDYETFRRALARVGAITVRRRG